MAASALAAASAALGDQQPGTNGAAKPRRNRGGRSRGVATEAANGATQAPTQHPAPQASRPQPSGAQPAPRQPAPAPAGDKPHHSGLRFADIPNLSSPTRRALQEDFGYEFATPVQAATIAPALAGNDLLSRARTGTGKTLGFGLPTIERLARNPQLAQQPTAIRAVIVSPTRELASQIAAELRRVCTFHGRHFGVQLIVGGTSRPAEEKRLRAGPNAILVCTPGRFHDHCENTRGFAALLKTTEVAVLDECDRLLEVCHPPAYAERLHRSPSGLCLRRVFVGFSSAVVAIMKPYPQHRCHWCADGVVVWSACAAVWLIDGAASEHLP